MPPGKSITGGLSSSERGISKAALDASRDYDKPVAGPSTVQEPAPRAVAMEEPSPAVKEAAPAVATTNDPIKTRPLTQPPSPATADAEAAPATAAKPGGFQEDGKHGQLGVSGGQDPARLPLLCTARLKEGQDREGEHWHGCTHLHSTCCHRWLSRWQLFCIITMASTKDFNASARGDNHILLRL